MLKFMAAIMVVLMCSLMLVGEKQKGRTALKDLQPAGTTDKNQKNQIYDFLFTTGDKSYTCRTNHDTKIKATDFVVGEDINFELDTEDAKLKNPRGKEVKCKIVRVEKAPALQN